MTTPYERAQTRYQKKKQCAIESAQVEGYRPLTIFVSESHVAEFRRLFDTKKVNRLPPPEIHQLIWQLLQDHLEQQNPLFQKSTCTIAEIFKNANTRLEANQGGTS